MARIFVIGGTGYLGALIVATLLTKTDDFVVLAARKGHQHDDIVARLRMEMSAAGDAAGHSLERLRVVRLPDPGDVRGYASLFRENRIGEVINCAGAVNYFDIAQLKQSNIDLINDLLTVSKDHAIDRFTHVSTAFACGYIDGVAKEELFDEPAADPTEYTRFKRRAEWLVAESGLPYLILRPSIVVGDSRDGHYFGPASGVYQLWWSFVKLLMDRYRPTLHAIASDIPLPTVHQDAFASTMLAAREKFDRNTIVNVVSDVEKLPTMRDLWRLWSDRVARPYDLILYDDIRSVPLATIDARLRAFLKFTAVNTEISGHHWRFDTGERDRLISEGARFPQVTIDTMARCQSRFVSNSEGVRRYYAQFESQFPQESEARRALATGDA